jgi:uncharacterized phiE125 gp8 family phage protein
MSLILLVPPAAVPVSLAEAKAHCRFFEGDEDAVIAGAIRAAVDYVEGYSGLRLINQTWAWSTTLPCFWSGYLRLPLTPVQAITSITYTDTAGDLQTLGPATYSLKGDRIILAPEAQWPSVWRGPDSATVTFTVGYGEDHNSIPHDIRQATMMLIAYWFNQREAAAIGAEAGPVSDVPFSVKQILEPYRVWAV